MAETTIEATPEVTEAPPAWSASAYLEARRKGADPQTAAQKVMAARQTQQAAVTTPAEETVQTTDPQPETNSTETPAGDPKPEQTTEETDKTKPDRRASLVADVQYQRNRAQEAERLLAEEREERKQLKARLEALEKGATAKPETPAKAEPAQAAPSKLEHPGAAPDFLTFDSIAEFNKANAAYMEKLADYKAGLLEEKLLGFYKTAEEEKSKESRKQAEQSEKQTAISKFTSAVMDAEKRPGYEGLKEKLSAPTMPISQDMMDILITHPRGVEIGKYLTDHPDEAARIYQMKRHADIGIAMGEIAGSVKQATAAAQPPPAKPKTSSAPAPPATVGSGGSVVGTLEEAAKSKDFLTYKKLRLQGKRPA